MSLKNVYVPDNAIHGFREAEEALKTWVDERRLARCAVWGAGKNGRLACAALGNLGVEVTAVYDDQAEGSIGSAQISRPPTRLPALPVVVAIDVRNPAAARVAERLRQQNVEVAVFSGMGGYSASPGGFHRDPRIAAFRNRHEGETAVILCNGPSLNKVDLNLLRGVPTFGLNKIYLLFERTDFRPDYLVSYIGDVVRQSVQHYLGLDMPLFLSQEAIRHIPPGTRENVYYMGEHKRFTFSLNPEMEICCGFTVTYVALQMAFFMGFRRVVIVGADHDFGYEGEPDKWTVIDKPRAMHFDPTYFDSGESWQTPNLRMIEAHYALARDAYLHMGREIVNATEGGKLEVFPRARLEELV